MPAFLDRLYGERETALALIDEVTNAAETDERDLSETEQQVIARNQARITDDLDPQIALGEATEASRNAHIRASGAAPEPVRRLAAAVDNGDGDEVVYRRFAHWARDELIRRYDVIAQAAGPNARAEAEQRIARVVANTTTTEVAGLLPRDYMTDIVGQINSARPIVNSSKRVPLQRGKLTYPQVTQRPSVAKQATEKSELSSTAMTVAFVDVLADTYGGTGDLSWQAVNWSTPDALTLWFDLAADEYARQTEAAAGGVLGALTADAANVVPAAPTVADWFTAITKAAATVYTNSRRMANVIYADIASGYGIIGLVSANVPVFLPGGSFDLGSGSGSVAGLQLVISPGLAAKRVIVGDRNVLLCAEQPGSPVDLRAVEPNIAGILVGVVGAFVAKVVDTNGLSRLTIT